MLEKMRSKRKKFEETRRTKNGVMETTTRYFRDIVIVINLDLDTLYWKEIVFPVILKIVIEDKIDRITYRGSTSTAQKHRDVCWWHRKMLNVEKRGRNKEFEEKL